jgi:hypothetical protein
VFKLLVEIEPYTIREFHDYFSLRTIRFWLFEFAVYIWFVCCKVLYGNYTVLMLLLLLFARIVKMTVWAVFFFILVAVLTCFNPLLVILCGSLK